MKTVTPALLKELKSFIAELKVQSDADISRRRFFRKRNLARKKFKPERIRKRYKALHSVYLVKKNKFVKKHFKNTLILRQAIRFMYGRLRNTQLSKIKAVVNTSQILVNRTDKFFDLLERRLPILLVRMNFVPTTIMAVQHILHGFVKVNGSVVTYPNFTVKNGDIVEFDYKLFRQYRTLVAQRKELPRHFIILHKAPMGIFLRSPLSWELAFPHYFKLRILRYFVDTFR